MDGVDGAVSSNPLNRFNRLIAWNNRFRVDDTVTEKRVAWFAQAETEILSKDADTFLKISFFRSYSHFFFCYTDSLRLIEFQNRQI